MTRIMVLFTRVSETLLSEAGLESESVAETHDHDHHDDGVIFEEPKSRGKFGCDRWSVVVTSPAGAGRRLFEFRLQIILKLRLLSTGQ
jgi:hypothetical protein